jgi:hypothetical protein
MGSFPHFLIFRGIVSVVILQVVGSDDIRAGDSCAIRWFAVGCFLHADIFIAPISLSINHARQQNSVEDVLILPTNYSTRRFSCCRVATPDRYKVGNVIASRSPPGADEAWRSRRPLICCVSSCFRLWRECELRLLCLRQPPHHFHAPSGTPSRRNCARRFFACRFVDSPVYSHDRSKSLYGFRHISQIIINLRVTAPRTINLRPKGQKRKIKLVADVDICRARRKRQSHMRLDCMTSQSKNILFLAQTSLISSGQTHD